MMNLDFSLNKYQRLLEKIIKSKYSILNVKKYFEIENDLPEKFVVLRHDVDSEPIYTLKIAILEKNLGIQSTYYFRNKDIDDNKDIILKISNLGHEIGYHYEMLDLTDGDYEKAIKIFEEYLKELRKICEVKTIAQHGSPIKGNYAAISFFGLYHLAKKILSGENIFTSQNNKDIWTKYNFNDFGIIGEAYLSIDFNELLYLSDTGRSWNSERYKIKDLPITSKLKVDLKSTDDLIEFIDKKAFNKLYLLIHVNQWKDSYSEWFKWMSFQKGRNFGKFLLKSYWKHTGKIT